MIKYVNFNIINYLKNCCREENYCIRLHGEHFEDSSRTISHVVPLININSFLITVIIHTEN